MQLRVLFRVIVIALLFACPLTRGDETGQRRRSIITELPDGRLRVDGKIFESRDAYYHSPEFLSKGGPCGAPERDPSVAPRGTGSASDCDYFSTTLSPDYLPIEGKFRIPVVVHVITSASGIGSLDYSNIQGQIDVMNEAFAGNSGLGADSQIEFFLATEDPSGNPTNGVTVTANDNWFVENGAYYDSLAWDTNRYMNVYTLQLLTNGLLGYVPRFPSEGNLVGTTEDRIVVHWGSFGSVGADGPPNNTGDVLVHETGHYLGLFHVFQTTSQGVCPDSDMPGCYNNGDLICETAPQLGPLFTPAGFCNTSIPGCGGLPDSINNFMSYSEEVCMYQFTPEQAQRMRCTLINYRPDLYEFDAETGAINVSPNADPDFIGLKGGPFSPSAASFILKNNGNSPADYQVLVDNNFGLYINGTSNLVMGTLNGGASRQVQVTLDASTVEQLADGTYTATLIFRDLTNSTVRTQSITLTVGQLYIQSTDVPVAIPDNNMVGDTSTIQVTKNGYIDDLNIGLTISHPYIYDVVVSLTHLDTGTSVTLIDRPFCAGANFVHIDLDDEGAGGNVQDQCVNNLSSPPGYRPYESLSVFDDENIKGSWRLRVRDLSATSPTGTLDNWSMTASISDTPPMDDNTQSNTQQDTDFDTVPDVQDNCPLIANPDQADLNGNGVGDACESINLSDCPSTVTLPATSKDGAMVDFDLPPAAGGFGNIQVFADPASGSLFPIGTTTVTVTAVDATQTQATCTFDVVVTESDGNGNSNGNTNMMNTSNCGCTTGAGGMMLAPITLIGIGFMRRRARRRRRG